MHLEKINTFLLKPRGRNHQWVGLGRTAASDAPGQRPQWLFVSSHCVFSHSAQENAF